MCKIRLTIILFILQPMYVTVNAQVLPPWQEGELDIHHINTGRGDATFFIFPDATTLLIDVGANNRSSERTVAAQPNEQKRSGEWIVDYIRNRMPTSKRHIDYYLMTHYHSDHIDGLRDVYQVYPCRTLLDRGNSYMLPTIRDKDTAYLGYRRFVDALPVGIRYESFTVGGNNQITLASRSNKYQSTFSVRNLYANGVMWDGKNSLRTLFPSTFLSVKEKPRENMCSCAIKLSYGDFDYYTGGDIPGYSRPGYPAWHDVETPLAEVIGLIEVTALNHHGNEDGTNECFLSTLQPQNIVLSTWDALHPKHTVLYRLFSKDLYKEGRNVFATNLHPAAKIVIDDLINKMASMQGHVVVRVLLGGKQYMIYVLEDGDTTYHFHSKFGPFNCKK